MDGRCRTGQVVDIVPIHVQRIGNAMTHELEMMVVEQRLYIVLCPGEEVVYTQDVVTIVQISLDSSLFETRFILNLFRTELGLVVVFYCIDHFECLTSNNIRVHTNGKTIDAKIIHFRIMPYFID